MDRITRESVDLFLETVCAKHSFALIQERGSLQGDSGTKRGHVIVCDERHDRTPAVVVGSAYPVLGGKPVLRGSSFANSRGDVYRVAVFVPPLLGSPFVGVCGGYRGC